MRTLPKPGSEDGTLASMALDSTLEGDLVSLASLLEKVFIIKHLLLVPGLILAGVGFVFLYERTASSNPLYLLNLPGELLFFPGSLLILIIYKCLFAGAPGLRLGQVQALHGLGRAELFDFSLGVEKLSKRYHLLYFLDSERAAAKEKRDRSEEETREKLLEAEYFFGLVQDDEDYSLVHLARQCQSAGRAEHEPGGALPLCLARVWFAACCMVAAREHVLINEHGIIGGHYNDIESWQACAQEALIHLENANLNPAVPCVLINTLISEAKRVEKISRQDAEREGSLKFVRTEYQDIGMFPRIMLPYWFQGMRETDFKKSDVIQYVKQLPSSDILLSSYEELCAMDADYKGCCNTGSREQIPG